MNIAVCVKQIPDPSVPYVFDDENHWMIRPDAQVLDDTDRIGVEMGLQIAEVSGGTVTLFSMSPAGTLQGIHQALAMGADGAVLIDDATLMGADALSTAKVLAAAISRSQFDLVIAGTESTDGYTGVVPQMLAELLDLPALSFARHVEIKDQKVTIERQTASGYDIVEASLPVLVTVTAGAVEPRYPTFKGIMEAKKKTIETLTCQDLGVDQVLTQTIISVEPVASRVGGAIVEDEGEAYMAIIELLRQKKVI